MVSFEVLEPAEITFPDNVSQLLVMHRLPGAHMLMDSVSLSTFGRKHFYGMDTLIAFNIYRGLYSCLQQSPVYSHKWPKWTFEIQTDIQASRNLRLNKREVAELCRKNYADAIVCLESCKLHLRLEDTTYVRGEIYQPHFRGSLRSHWVVYLPDRPKPFQELDITDTIDHWIWRKRTNAFEIVRKTAQENGRRFGEKVTPHWENSGRPIYSGSHALLHKASTETDMGNWDKALENWSKLAESGSRYNRAKALYNMAVYYELEDNLDKAANLLDTAAILQEGSVFLKKDTLITYYRGEMHRRIDYRKSILQQVEGARIYRLP